MITEIPIRAVLDRSAIRSYGLGHVHVGEVLAEIATEEAAVGVPTAALADAQLALAGDEVARARLKLLVQLPGARPLDLDVISVFGMAGAMEVTGGDLALAQAAMSADLHAAVYLTTEPDEAAGLVPPDRIVTVPAKDA